MFTCLYFYLRCISIYGCSFHVLFSGYKCNHFFGIASVLFRKFGLFMLKNIFSFCFSGFLRRLRPFFAPRILLFRQKSLPLHCGSNRASPATIPLAIGQRRTGLCPSPAPTLLSFVSHSYTRLWFLCLFTQKPPFALKLPVPHGSGVFWPHWPFLPWSFPSMPTS